MVERKVVNILHNTFKSDFLNIMLAFFINKGNELLSPSSKNRGINSELKTKIKKAIQAKEGS